MALGAAVTITTALSLSVPAIATGPAGDSGLTGSAPPAPVTPQQPIDLHPMQDIDGSTAADNAAMHNASARARSTGKPVVVGALTSETDQITAQPGGGFEYSGTPTPTRTKKNGSWTSIDTSLRRNSDGTYSPVATAYGSVKFSGGGGHLLATTTSGRTSYSLSWPGKLPEPEITGPTATYRDVLDDVDLVVSATNSGGFHEVLVVKTAHAAADKALRSIQLPATIRHGIRPAGRNDSGLITANPDTGMVLEAATPLMWDSNRGIVPDSQRQAAPAATAEDRRGGPDASDAGHAGQAARVATVKAHFGTGDLQLIPDQTLLRSKSTVFPVYIDPTPNWHPGSGGTAAFDEVKQGSPCNGASYYYNNTGSAGNYGNLGVGYNGFSTCVGAEHAYYQWTIPATVKAAGTIINSATVNATETYSSYCSVTATVNLHWTGAIGSGTDWNNRPGFHSGFSTSQSFGPSENPDSCPNADTVTHGFNVLGAFVKARTGSKFTVVLSQDSNESSKNREAFKRFSDNPSLQIFYNKPPSTPTAAQLSAVSGTNNVGCDTASPYPYMGKSIATNTPVLSAKVSDPDSDKMRATFKYWVDGTTTTYTVLSNDNVTSGSPAKASLPATFINGLTDGKIVDWQVSVTDGLATTAYPTWSCHFVAEPHAVLDPSIDPNTTYPDTDNGGGTGAAAGTATTFTLHNVGTAATKFVYNLDVPPSTTSPVPAQTVTASNNTATTPPIAPLAPGPHTLWVAAIDAAGDASATEGYSFMAAGHINTICANLAACFNNTAISSDANMSQGAADGSLSFSATDLTNAGWSSAGRVIVNGTGFTLPAFGAGQADNVMAANQSIDFPYPVPTTGPTSLQFLATSTYAHEASPGAIEANSTAPYVPAGIAVAGTYCFDGDDPAAYCPARGSITYSDNSVQTYVLNVPDWVYGPSSLAAVALPHRNGPSGQTTDATKQPKIYPFSVPLAAGKTVTSVTLPDVSNKAVAPGEGLHIFGMAARNTTAGTIETNGTTATPAAGRSWTGAWASPTEFAYNYLTPVGTNFSNMTFRTAVKPSISGDTVRIRLDNALGTSALTIGHSTIALDGGTPPVATPSGAFHNLTFGGAASIKIPAGGMAYSDPLTFTVTANQWLLVSFSLTNSVASLPEHSWASDTDHIYTSVPGSGDHTADTAATAFTGTGTHSGNFTNLLTNIDVTTAGITTQAVFGDGLIDAFQPNTLPNRETGVRLSDDLLAAEPTTPAPFGTIAEGIESNYLMTDNPQYYTGRSIGGPSALSRIDRDILSQPNITTVVLDEGLEDVLNGRDIDSLESDGFGQLLTYLKYNNINVVVVGLRPCDGYGGDGATTAAGASANDPCTAAVDANRVDVNNWISGGGPGMGPWSTPAMFYIDADAAIGVPDTNNGETKLDPNAVVAADNINFTDAGYAALASAYLSPQDTWALNDADTDPAATAAADSASGADNPYLVNNPRAGQNPAALLGGAAWATDTTRGTVLSLNGTDAGASTLGQVLTTTGSYTLSAWVRLTDTTNTSTVAAQQGVNNSAFALQYSKTYNAWTFAAAGSDSATPTTSPHANAASAPALNTWTHLVGSYNAATHTMTLYVNGTKIGTATNTTPWDSTGKFDIGHSAAGSYFPGTISNVQAWDYTLTPQQVTALYQQIH